MARQTELVYEALKNKIDQGEYAPAQNLPESSLAEEFNVSRNTIKKALLMLENDGYVTVELNKGAKVRSYSKSEVLQFLELREVLEGFIVRLTVPCLQDGDIEMLGADIAQMDDYGKKGDLLNYSKSNRSFHDRIYGLCPNRTAVDVTTRLKSQMKKYNGKTVLVPGRCEQSLKEHRALFEAMRRRDAPLAERLMCEHIRNVRRVFDQYYTILF